MTTYVTTSLKKLAAVMGVAGVGVFLAIPVLAQTSSTDATRSNRVNPRPSIFNEAPYNRSLSTQGTSAESAVCPPGQMQMSQADMNMNRSQQPSVSRNRIYRVSPTPVSPSVDPDTRTRGITPADRIPTGEVPMSNAPLRTMPEVTAESNVSDRSETMTSANARSGQPSDKLSAADIQARYEDYKRGVGNDINKPGPDTPAVSSNSVMSGRTNINAQTRMGNMDSMNSQTPMSSSSMGSSSAATMQSSVACR